MTDTKIIEQDYHEKLMHTLQEAVTLQMNDIIGSGTIPHYETPEAVIAIINATYQTVAAIDSKTNKVNINYGALMGEGDKRFPAPHTIGVNVRAVCFHDEVAENSLAIDPSSRGVTSSQVQRSLPELVYRTVISAQEAGKKAYNQLEKESSTTPTNFFACFPVPERTEYMSVKLDPNDMTTQQKMVDALSRIKATLEDRVSNLNAVQAQITHTATFIGVYGQIYDKYGQGNVETRMSPIRSTTKDPRVTLNITAKLKNGTEATFFEGCTGGLEGLKYVYYDPNQGKAMEVSEFDSVIERIVDHVVWKLKERDTTETIASLGNSAPVVLSPKAAASLIYAVSMFATGTMMRKQMESGKKDLVSKIGTSILRPEMNIVADGRQAGEGVEKSNRYGSMLIDAEGTTVQPVTIVERGVLKTPITSRESLLPVLYEARMIEGTEVFKTEAGRSIQTWKTADAQPLKGFARRKGYSSLIVDAPTNIDLRPDPKGPTKLDDIVGKIGQSQMGLYVEEVNSVSLEANGTIAINIDLGYQISNGARNPAVKYNKGTVYLDYHTLKDAILAISGPGTEMPVAMDAQVASGQVMPISVCSPFIVLSTADFKARGKFGSNAFHNYVDDLDKRGPDAWYDKLAEERRATPLSEESMILTAMPGPARIKQSVLHHTSYVEDIMIEPQAQYRLDDTGELIEA